MQNVFPEGSVVYAKEMPDRKLVVRRYVDRIYYCVDQTDTSKKELVYFERELVPKA